MNNIVIFGAPHSGKTTLLGYLSTAMLRHPQFNEEVLQKLKMIKKMGMEDDFHIGDPYNPIHIRKDIILPSFVSLDRDELRKFTDKNITTLGGSKRLHHKQLTLCMSERRDMWNGQDENENMSCTFIDLPGFHQRISDKYRGFFEGNIGIAMIDIAEALKLENALQNKISDNENKELIDKQERKLFEPVRIWCDYRSPENLIIVLSKIDQKLEYNGNEADVERQIDAVQRAVECIRKYTKIFGGKNKIPIVPISIRITQEVNNKKRARMKVFFHREEENIYAEPIGKCLPGDGTLITCLRRLLEPYIKGQDRAFSMASVERAMQAMVNYTKKTALQICTVHGTLRSTDTILLGPVLDKRMNEICYLKCTIASLKEDGAKETSPMLLEGNVGGVIFKSIVNSEGRASKQYILSSMHSYSDIRILRSTLLFIGRAVEGDIVVLEIYRKEYLTINGEIDPLYTKILRSLMPYDELILFWYGKKIQVKVIEINFKTDKLCLSVILSKTQKNSVPFFMLPESENGEIRHYDNALLAIPDTNFKEPIYTYISVNIREIKSSDEYDAIQIKGRRDLGLTESLKGNIHFELKHNFEDDIVWIPIKSKEKNYSIDAILTSINKSLKRYFWHMSFYRKEGGIEVSLIKMNGERK